MNQTSKIQKHSQHHTIKLNIDVYNIINLDWIRLNRIFQTPTRKTKKQKKQKKKQKEDQPNHSIWVGSPGYSGYSYTPLWN